MTLVAERPAQTIIGQTTVGLTTMGQTTMGQTTLGQATDAPASPPRGAVLYRMVMDDHVCPYGLKARDLLRRRGYAVDDRWLRTREETDAFKAEHHVRTTPQAFVAGERGAATTTCAAFSAGRSPIRRL